jgi:hypothetical protein
MTIKEQLAGLVSRLADANQMYRESRTTMRSLSYEVSAHLAAMQVILGTLPEPGMVSDEAVDAAVTAACRMRYGERREYSPSMRGAVRLELEAALPYLTLAAPAGEAVELTVCCGREECGGECGNEWHGTTWYRKAAPDAQANLNGKRITTAWLDEQAAQGFDAEVEDDKRAAFDKAWNSEDYEGLLTLYEEALAAKGVGRG